MTHNKLTCLVEDDAHHEFSITSRGMTSHMGISVISSQKNAIANSSDAMACDTSGPRDLSGVSQQDREKVPIVMADAMLHCCAVTDASM